MRGLHSHPNTVHSITARYGKGQCLRIVSSESLAKFLYNSICDSIYFEFPLAPGKKREKHSKFTLRLLHEYILVESPGNKIDINCMPPET